MVGPWGDAIRRLREARQLTRKQVAKAAKLSPTTYGLVERGGHTQTRKLEQIARALQVDLVDVLVPPRDALQQTERRELVRMVTEDVLRALDARASQQRDAPDPIQYGGVQNSRRTDTPSVKHEQPLKKRRSV